MNQELMVKTLKTVLWRFSHGYCSGEVLETELQAQISRLIEVRYELMQRVTLDGTEELKQFDQELFRLENFKRQREWFATKFSAEDVWSCCRLLRLRVDVHEALIAAEEGYKLARADLALQDLEVLPAIWAVPHAFKLARAHLSSGKLTRAAACVRFAAEVQARWQKEPTGGIEVLSRRIADEELPRRSALKRLIKLSHARLAEQVLDELTISEKQNRHAIRRSKISSCGAANGNACKDLDSRSETAEE